jgi:hypothetical protein
MQRMSILIVMTAGMLGTPEMVQILAGVARNFITNIHVGREFNMTGNVPRLGQDVPRW